MSRLIIVSSMAKRSEIKPSIKRSKSRHTEDNKITNKARQHIVEEKQSEDILDDTPMDKSDSEYTSCVEKNRQMFQDNIDKTEVRDRQVAKAEDDRENKRAIKVVSHDEFQELEKGHSAQVSTAEQEAQDRGASA
jgi:hypothetical protein